MPTPVIGVTPPSRKLKDRWAIEARTELSAPPRLRANSFQRQPTLSPNLASKLTGSEGCLDLLRHDARRLAATSR
jgi:hypothetical protein